MKKCGKPFNEAKVSIDFFHFEIVNTLSEFQKGRNICIETFASIKFQIVFSKYVWMDFINCTWLIALHSFNMSKSLFSCWDQSGSTFFKFSFVFIFFIKSFVVRTKTTFLRGMTNHGRIAILKKMINNGFFAIIWNGTAAGFWLCSKSLCVHYKVCNY